MTDSTARGRGRGEDAIYFDTAKNRYVGAVSLENDEDRDGIRTWLSGISQQVPSELGVADEIEAATSGGISLELIEDSCSADVTQVTWRPNDPNPQGSF